MKALLTFGIILTLLASCAKEEMPQPTRIGVCDMAWDCGWTYSQFTARYGDPERFTIDTIQSVGQLQWVRRIAYWSCYEVRDIDGRVMEVPIAEVYTEFTDGKLVSWVIIEL